MIKTKKVTRNERLLVGNRGLYSVENISLENKAGLPCVYGS